MRTSMGRRCCCLDDCTNVYQLSECESSTSCPVSGLTGGVWVSCAALEWLQKQDESPYTICFSQHCCVSYEQGVTELNGSKSVPEGGVLISSKTEGQVGIPIQDYPVCDCDDCETAEGACCFRYLGKCCTCITRTQQQCLDMNDIPNVSDAEYQGDDTCCATGRPPSCPDCPDDLCIECPNPPDGPECELYTGNCLDKGGKVTTCGDGGGVGCSTTYTIAIQFPNLDLYTGSGGVVAPGDCSHGQVDCPNYSTGDTCCKTNIGIIGTTIGQLTQVDHSDEYWESAEEPEIGGALDGQWHPKSTCLLGSPETHDRCFWTPGDNPQLGCNFCGTAQGGHQSYDICANGIDGWDCPCCGAEKFVDFKWSAWAWQGSQSHNPDGYDYCEPPCNHYTVRIKFMLGINGCLGETACGLCASDWPDPCDQDAVCYASGYTVEWKIRRPNCGCPAGLTSGNAYEVDVLGTMSDIPNCYHDCGCSKWIDVGFGYRGKLDQAIQGTSFTIS